MEIVQHKNIAYNIERAREELLTELENHIIKHLKQDFSTTSQFKM